MSAHAVKDKSTTGRLRGNAIGVIGAVVISMAFMGPATAVFFNTAPMTAGAGYALAASMLLALITSVIVASSIAAFAQKIPPPASPTPTTCMGWENAVASCPAGSWHFRTAWSAPCCFPAWEPSPLSS